MKANGLTRRATTALLALGAAVSLPEALAAACQTSYWCDMICYQLIECCGPTTCCTTAWNGSMLVGQVCEPRG